MSHRSSCAEYVLPEMWWGSITKSIDVAYYVITLCLHPIDMSCEARTGIEVNEACENKQQRYKYTRKVLTDECIWVEFTFISYPFFNWTWKVVELGVFDIVWTLSRMIEECTHTHGCTAHKPIQLALSACTQSNEHTKKKSKQLRIRSMFYSVFCDCYLHWFRTKELYSLTHTHVFAHKHTREQPLFIDPMINWMKMERTCLCNPECMLNIDNELYIIWLLCATVHGCFPLMSILSLNVSVSFLLFFILRPSSPFIRTSNARALTQKSVVALQFIGTIDRDINRIGLAIETRK